MCGISGIVEQSGAAIDRTELEKMTNLVAHRGPDAQGFFIEQNIGLGHRRLAIIDRSEKANQPFCFQERYVMVFNGQLYNYLELRTELEQNGYCFSSSSDTEVLISAYDAWGIKCLDRFNGMWSFVIYDKQEQQLFCARDRFGIKPFYYAEFNNKFCIASEIKQFTAIAGWQPKLNLKIASEFLSTGFHDHTNKTFFEGVFQLLPGNYLTYCLKHKSLRFASYYDLDKIVTQKSEELKQGDFFELLSNSVKLRMRADVPIGCTLSGGLDSSSIAVLMNRHQNTDVPLSVFSAVFPGSGQDESKYIKAIGEKIGASMFRVIPSVEDLAQEIDQLIWHQDEPFASTSVLAQTSVFRLAKKNGITVLLEGQGADEILAGYDKFYLPFIKKLWKTKPMVALNELRYWLSANGFKSFGAIGNFLKFKKRYARTSPNWLTIKMQKTLENQNHQPSTHSIREMSLDAMFKQGLRIFLHYADRNAMRFSVESRVPFLDHQLVEYCLGLEDIEKIHKGKSKYILRKSLSELLPYKVANRGDKNPYDIPDENLFGHHQCFFSQQIKMAYKEYGTLFTKEVLAVSNPNTIWRIVLFYRWMKIFKVYC